MSITATQQVWTRQASGSERLVLLVLADHADDNGIAWPAKTTISWRTDLSYRHVTRLLTKLLRRGWISVARRGGGRAPTAYQLHLDRIPPKPPPATPPRDMPAGDPGHPDVPPPRTPGRPGSQEPIAGDPGHPDVPPPRTSRCPGSQDVPDPPGHLDVPPARTPRCPPSQDIQMSPEPPITSDTLQATSASPPTPTATADSAPIAAAEEEAGYAATPPPQTALGDTHTGADNTHVAAAHDAETVAADALAHLVAHLPPPARPRPHQRRQLHRLLVQTAAVTGWPAERLTTAILRRSPGELATARNGYAVLARRLRDELADHNRHHSPPAAHGADAEQPPRDDQQHGDNPLDALDDATRAALLQRAREQLPAWLAARNLPDHHPLVLAEARRLHTATDAATTQPEHARR